MEGVIHMCVDQKGSGEQQPEGKCIAWCQNKCLHSGPLSSKTKKQMVMLLAHVGIRRL